jgi:hypothetical protein
MKQLSLDDLPKPRSELPLISLRYADEAQNDPLYRCVRYWRKTMQKGYADEPTTK